MIAGDPYTTLGVPPDADDAAIRARYLQLVKEFTPEQQPARFAAVRAAYEAVKDLDSRVRLRLFAPGEMHSIDSILEDLQCRTPRPRIALTTLLSTAFPASR